MEKDKKRLVIVNKGKCGRKREGKSKKEGKGNSKGGGGGGKKRKKRRK